MWLRTRLFADSGLLRRRGAAALLALGIELLLALLLFYLAPPLPSRKEERRTTVFGIEAPKSADSPDRKPADKQAKPAARAQRAQAQPRTQPPPPVPLPIETPVPAGPPSFLKLSRNDYQQGDIAKVPSHGPVRSESNEVAENVAHDDDSPILGTGPNGEPYYGAEWYRKPTAAMFAPYLPRGWAKNGTGKVLCRMDASYRLEDCRILDESPKGSGYGYATLQAAWQFRMIPPRRGGKVVPNARILIDVTYSTIEK